MRKKTIVSVFIILLFLGTLWYFHKNQNIEYVNEVAVSTLDRLYGNIGLKTNTSISSIPLDEVLGGGPSKDGIPAIDEPKFTSIKDAESWLESTDDGVVVTVGKTTRFYPFNILVWHEIVNDTIEGKALTITFCPLCGSSVVFEGETANGIDSFGVSGKLYESNLLMYDRKTESLWSQILGEALVGERTGEKLALYPSQVISFEQAIKNYPNLKILSKKTGHIRNYNSSPYGNYNESDEIFFPVAVNDTRLPSKEIMYVVNVGDKSIAFHRKNLIEAGEAKISVSGENITAMALDGEIEVRDKENKIIPGYFAMWFSWATHHQEDGILWQNN